MPTYHHDIDLPELKAELARRRIPQWKLGHMLGYSESSISQFLRLVTPPPRRLREDIEDLLGLETGELKDPKAPPRLVTKAQREAEERVMDDGDGAA